MSTQPNDSVVKGNSANGDGGGIFNARKDTLTLNDSKIADNEAGSLGGGIINFGTVDIINGSVVSGNRARNDGGGIFNNSEGTLTLDNSEITDNEASDNAGGIGNLGTMDITNGSVVRGNSANSDGGGIYNASEGMLTLSNSEITDNETGVFGGGIVNYGSVDITNRSAVSNNKANDDGGGIFNTSDGMLRLNNSEITDNETGDFGGGIINYGTSDITNGSVVRGNKAREAGGIFIPEGVVTVLDSLVHENFVSGSEGGPDIVTLFSGRLVLDRDRTPRTSDPPAQSAKYKLTSRASNWREAEAEAVAMGGHLVTINNRDEQALLVSLFLSGNNRTRAYWIGLTDQNSEGRFRWISGEPVTYTNWNLGEPNNCCGGEDYGVMNWQIAHGRIFGVLGDWNDAPLEGLDGFLFGPENYRGIVELP